jgi:hypothetical protein
VKTTAQILADQLIASLTEACCDHCGRMRKKSSKPMCCGGKKTFDPTVEPRDEAPKPTIGKMATEENHFLYEFPSPEKAKAFAEEAKKYGWPVVVEGAIAGMITKAFADEVAGKFDGKDLVREGLKDPRAKESSITPFLMRCFEAATAKPGDETKTEAKGQEKHTHPFIKRCVAAMTSGKSASRNASDPGQLSSAFAICTASKKQHPGAAKEKAKEGVPEKRMGQYEKALSKGREARAAAK